MPSNAKSRTIGAEGRGGYKRSDQRVQEDVSDRLYDDPYVDASEIEVSVVGGEVTLGGTVDSRHARRRAEDIAEGVSGVTHVQNNPRVHQGGVSGRKDAIAYGGAQREQPSSAIGPASTTVEQGAGSVLGTDVTAAEDPAQVGGFGESIAYAAKPGTSGGGSGSSGGSNDAGRRE
jgi:hypothetical protein